MRCVVALLMAYSAVAAEPLVLNGDFEQADAEHADRPAHWQQPDGLGAQWLPAPVGGHGKAICLDTSISEQAMVAQWTKVGLTEWVFPKPANDVIAATYGLSFYSDAFPIVAGTRYRVTVRYHGSGGAKVWVRGYGEKAGKQRRLYESQGACPAANDGWQDFTQDFDPTAHTPAVTTMKVMLFAYWPAGKSWFDDVRVAALPEPEKSASPKP